METNNQKVIRISKKKLIITLIVLVIGAYIVLNSLGTARMKSGVDYAENAMMPSGGGSYGGANIPVSSGVMPDYYPYPYPEQDDVTDTREFLKTSYSGNLKTRDVSETADDVKNIVRDVEGRLDNFNTSEKYSYITFVVPKSRFDEFKNRVGDLVGAKLYVESISSQNLLNQKQSIEGRTETAEEALVTLEKRKKDLATAHVATLNNIKSELTATQSKLNITESQILLTDDPGESAALRSQLAVLLQTQADLLGRQSVENQNFANQNKWIDQSIAQTKAQLTNLDKEDTKFANNIETVNGTVNIQWISVWDLIKLYSPINPILIIIIVLLLARWILVRKGYLSRIEFV